MINITKAYALDDVLLKPKFSSIGSRQLNVDLGVELPKGFKFGLPICSANMKAITEVAMANAITEMGGMALLHRFCSPEQQLEMFKQCAYQDRVGISIGVKDGELQRAKLLVDAGCRILCLDIAHAHSVHSSRIIPQLINQFKDQVLIIAGNIATYKGAQFLYELGVDVIKCGIGNGATCSTRIQTGNGVPQLTALSDVYDLYLNANSFRPKDCVAIMADGGIKEAGDIAKSLCFSSMVMVGRVLAGTDESPTEKEEIEGRIYKRYFGSSTLKNRNIEGVSGLVPYEGPVHKVIEKMMDGLRSCCSYQGVTNLKDLRINPEFVEISHSGLIESRPHDIKL